MPEAVSMIHYLELNHILNVNSGVEVIIQNDRRTIK